MNAHVLGDLRVRTHRVGVEEARGRLAGDVLDVPQAHDGHGVAEVDAVTAPMNSKKPRPVHEHRNGAKWNQPTPRKEGTVPMAVTIQANGRVRPHLTVAGKDTNAGIEVTTVRAEALAKCLNTLLTGELAPIDEVTTLELLLAAAYDKGVDEGRRALAGVS